ncbi:hypothetical protein [Sphaerisporangium krabiense]|uniref:Uncharacterized protein n=1 Tax=Sphaerisporangium krabiense TaxID=763782 RepID=A0A7W8Z9C1_9ACTN|nr:hypothetical protein [Sphaerisporangium krabiense]MBB5629443.1 hypothetical protein [Sphaerisporangium krabiense]
MTRTAFIVGISIPMPDFRAHLTTVPGAEFLRELPPARAVVAVPSREAARALARLDGVTWVREDRPERLL